MCHKLGPSSDACRRELWGGSWPRQNTDCADRYWHLIKGYHWEADVGIRGAQRWNRWPRTRPIVAPKATGISADMSRRDTCRVSEEGSLEPPLRGRWWSAEHGARSTQWKWSWLQGAANLGVVEVGSPSVKRNPVVLFSFRNKRDARSRNRPIVWVA